MATLLPRLTRPDGTKYHDYWHGMDPSTAACIIFAGLFGVGAIYHTYQLFRYRAWYFISFVAGAYMMCLGYIFRYVSIKSAENLGPYVMQTLFIILPPSLYAATIYMLYGRLVLLVNAAELSLIRPTWVTKIFVAGDAFSFILQAGGGAMLTMDGKETMGKNILLIGLFFQLAAFGFFLIVSAIFYWRVRNLPRPAIPNYGRYHWTTMLKIMYIAAALIIVRCIFRIIEFSADRNSAVRNDEIYAYCLDAAPMLFVQSIFHAFHGGMVLPSHRKPGMRESLRSRDSAYELTRD